MPRSRKVSEASMLKLKSPRRGPEHVRVGGFIMICVVVVVVVVVVAAVVVVVVAAIVAVVNVVAAAVGVAPRKTLKFCSGHPISGNFF